LQTCHLIQRTVGINNQIFCSTLNIFAIILLYTALLVYKYNWFIYKHYMIIGNLFSTIFTPCICTFL